MNIHEFADALELMGAQQRRRYRRAPMATRFRQAPAYGDIQNPAALPKCWNDEVGNELIAQCRQNHPQCTPQHVADMLSLDYCPGAGPTGPRVPASSASVPAKQDGSTLSYFALTFLVGAITGAYLWSEVGHQRSRRL